MKKLVTMCAVVTIVLAASGVAVAVQTVDFDAVALRASNTGSIMPSVSENAEEDGMIANTPLGGQKVYYGTDYFNGWALNSIEEVSFTYKPTEGPVPYINLVITDGSGGYGIIFTPAAISSIAGSTDENRAVYTIAGSSANFKFFEPYNTSYTHGSNHLLSDFSGWSLLGAGQSRPLSIGEAGVARGPVTDGLNIVWGDSQSNYLGDKEIYDVMVVADGSEYEAGKVVPVPGAFLLGGIGVACVGWMKRRRSL